MGVAHGHVLSVTGILLNAILARICSIWNAAGREKVFQTCGGKISRDHFFDIIQHYYILNVF
jgi:hypothetical protein